MQEHYSILLLWLYDTSLLSTIVWLIFFYRYFDSFYVLIILLLYVVNKFWFLM